MSGLNLIGRVTAQYLRNALDVREPDEGTARFLLDRLTGEQIAVICQTILSTPDLAKDVEIKVPEVLGKEYGLPDEVLTSQGPVHWRHAACSKAALLLASVNDNEEQSLSVLTLIGARDIKTAYGLWIEVAGQALPIPPAQVNWWEKALKGLLATSEFSLDQFAEYVALTARCVTENSLPIRDALGWSLPVIGLPRDTGYFQAIPEKKLGQAKSWEKMFKNAASQRGCLLLKQTPTRKLIEADELKNQFNNVRQDIPEQCHQIIENFIASPPGWDEASLELAQLEWERDNINSLFSGLRTKKTDLPSATIEFFEEEHPSELTQEEQDYLENLRKRRNFKEPIDDDREFYDSHRKELEENRSLKAKWDKFVYGQPIECTDFLAGLLSAVERLFERADRPIGKKKLTIRTQKGAGQSKWLELNADVGLYFCTRYRGIEKLTAPEARWETYWLFKYDELLEKAAKKTKYKRNESTARGATEIKFVVELAYRSTADEDVQTVQLVWRGNPNSIGMELRNDLGRMAKSPFLISEVRRELVNKKGKLQGVALNDVATLTAVFGRDCGSLIGTQKLSDDLAKNLPRALKNAVQEQSLSTVEAQSVDTAWSVFADSYKEAIQSLISNTGIADDSLLKQVDAYHELMRTLLNHARGDKNRNNVLAPILRIGCVKVTGGKPAAIIAPWHPLRLAAIAVKSRQVSGLLKHILNSEQVDFGDSKLFFSDLRIELEHPYYPEICVEYAGEEPKLLCVSDTVNDYSLMERPIREQFDQPTHENPADAAGKLLDLTKRYLELLPHEKINLTVVLYNCDSARLPQYVVSKLSEMEEERDEVRCQVTLRHQNTEKLNRLYREMIEGFDADPDAYVASEMSQDYLAKLRIGVMADEAPMRDEKEGRVADLVFMQDVISRQAQEKWENAPPTNGYPGLLDHVPPRWSRKRALRKDELKSTAYLVCPRQPEVGESYVQAVACIVKSEDAPVGQVPLPVRQILFSSQETSKIFEEVHRLGEWVINYDNLIERRQLMNKGVKVIRYQQSQTDGRNLLVSSKAPLNLLEVLVRRRLSDLSLGLSDQELGELTRRFIDEANVVSGDIVLRAAKRGHFASELIGVVLSKILVAAEMGDSPIGWYFLDDYASWLGQKEEQIADIMAICPKISNGKHFLKIVITESKYITEDSFADSRKKSQKQLWETVARIESAVFGNPGRLDRDLWLSRISDIMLEGIEQGINSPIQIEEWRNDLRIGQLPIDLSGYSHVFVSGPSGSSRESEQIKIPKVERCYQEVFSREQVRELVIAFHRNQPVSSVREKLGDEKPWMQSDPQPPADRVSWHSTAFQVAAPRKAVISSVAASEVDKTPIHTAPDDGGVEETDTSSAASVKINGKNSNEGVLANQPSATPIEQSEDSQGAAFAAITDEPVPQPTLNDVGSWVESKAVNPEDDTSAQVWLKETVQRLRNALISYELQAQVLGQRLTPNAALVRLRGTDRLTVDGLERKLTQLLTTHALKVINVSALPGEVLVSIARPQRQGINLAEVWAKRRLNVVSGVNLSLVVGVKEVDGEILYLNLAREFGGLQQHAPHTLIAGATGSGKSVLLRNLLLDVCSFNSPHDAKIYLIDPKSGVDYFALEELPHLTEGIIDDRSKAIDVLGGLVAEMDRRYSHFRQARVSDLMTFNAKVAPSERMPVLLAVHDEFAEWMLVEEYRDEVSAIVQRLGAKARAAGIHLIFAAQRPDATVFPMQLRDNLGNRLILKVESIGTSEIALGQKGAELLLGKGHVIARLTGESDLIFAQVPFISNDDAAELVGVIRSNYKS